MQNSGLIFVAQNEEISAMLSAIPRYKSWQKLTPAAAPGPKTLCVSCQMMICLRVSTYVSALFWT
jgi:hypothetical protein